MPSGEQVQLFISAAWQLMLGRRDAIRMFDLSADGFWNSFYAIIVAAPMMFVGWVATANGFAEIAPEMGGRLSIVIRVVAIYLLAWVVPLIVFAFMARPIGIADRFVAFVVASNWGSVISAAIILPISLLQLIVAPDPDLINSLMLLALLIGLVLNWRLTNAAIDRGAGIATAVFLATTVLSIVLGIALQILFGLVADQV